VFPFFSTVQVLSGLCENAQLNNTGSNGVLEQWSIGQ
jgi:hypothetical protein